MRALSLWQPWSSAVALGAKRIETRHWSTKYRGPLAIHAAKRIHKGELIDFGNDFSWVGALAGCGIKYRSGAGLAELLPFGAIVAVADLVACLPTEALETDDIGLDEVRYPDPIESPFGWTERQMGNFGPQRYGWLFENVRALPKPVPFRGLQGLFNVPDEVLA